MLGCTCSHVPQEVINSGMATAQLAGLGDDATYVDPFPDYISTQAVATPDISLNPASGGFNWAPILNSGFATGLSVFKSVFSDKPTYQTVKNADGSTSTTYYGSGATGITAIPGLTTAGITPSFGTLAIGALAIWGISKMFSGGSGRH